TERGQTAMIRATCASLAALLIVIVPLRAQGPAKLPPYGGQPTPAMIKLKDYLTPDGQLTATLEVRNEKKGFGVFYGRVWRIEPHGTWVAFQIYRNERTIRGQGKFDKKTLRKLAEALAENDPLTLPNVGRPVVNPHVTTVIYGTNRVEKTFGVDQ